MLVIHSLSPVIPFFFKAFKQENTLSLSEPALIGLLAEQLRHHSEDLEDLEDARIEFGEDEEKATYLTASCSI